MKSSSNYPTTRRPAASRRQVRLDLRRVEPRRKARDDDERDGGSSFWFWAGIVALFHVIVLVIVAVAYHSSATTPPPEPFISLLPQGETSQGTPGQQAAPKLGATTPAPKPPHKAAESSSKSEVTPEKPITHTKSKPKPKPEPTAIADKPSPVAPKPEPPKPKVKVDLTLADGPEDTDEPAPKPKPHLKKAPVHPATDTDATDADAAPASTGLSKEQVAEKLGAKLTAAGVEKAPRVSTSGSPDGQTNDFSDFYAAIRDQVLSKWQSPNLTDQTAVFPVVQIHVESDGRVPPELVKLVQSSGNAEYDDSALAVARNVGYLLQPLPPKCPPDISITFKLTR